MRNTKKKGLIRIIVSPYKNHFIGAVLDFNIVEEGNSPQGLKESLWEAARGYIETVQKENLDDSLLNDPAPKQYWDKYYQLREAEKLFNLKTSPQQTAMPKSLLNIIAGQQTYSFYHYA